MADIIFADIAMNAALQAFRKAKHSLNEAIRYCPKDGVDLPLFEAQVYADEAIAAINDTIKELRARVY